MDNHQTQQHLAEGTMICDLCGADAVHEARPRVIACKGQEKTIAQPATYCDTCGEATLTGNDRKETRKTIAEFHAGVKYFAR